eukprot:1202784-Prymnesium_polylepis.1
MLKRAPPAVRALDSPRVRALWPFAWLGADAAGGHIVAVTHSRHVLLQGKHYIRPFRTKYVAEATDSG